LAQVSSFREHATRCRAEAAAATLHNVRDRCLRAEAAWLEMALRQERTADARAERDMHAGKSGNPLQEFK